MPPALLRHFTGAYAAMIATFATPLISAAARHDMPSSVTLRRLFRYAAAIDDAADTPT